jgi:glycosyltransferase involved in cell wall biosynthesis
VVKNVLLHGWRGITHSFSVVNQFQARWLSVAENIRLFHEDAPFYSPLWSASRTHQSDEADPSKFISRLPRPGFHDPIDAVYSIVYPFVKYSSHLGLQKPKKVVTFMVTEFGVIPRMRPLLLDPPSYTQDNDCVVTPSHWSRDKLLEAGLDNQKLYVIPHGFEESIFYPIPPDLRTVQREALGINQQDNFIFFNNGAMTANKGVFSLVRVFAQLCEKYPNIRLILKDSKQLYGISAQKVVESALASMPVKYTTLAYDNIKFLDSNLTYPQLNLIYNIADCYVSPYYAEGFNLPVLESMATGTPVVVTDGGATDDFCPANLVRKISAAKKPNSTIEDKSNEYSSIPGYHLDPNLDSLLHEMESAIGDGTGYRNLRAYSHVRENFTWKKVVEPLTTLLTS